MLPTSDLNRHTNVSVYTDVILSTLLHGSVSLITNRSHHCFLECFHQLYLYTIHNIHWSDLITNIGVVDKAAVTVMRPNPLAFSPMHTIHHFDPAPTYPPLP